MNLRQCLLTNNDCYKTGRKITPKGVMVHSTGANNPNLRRYVQPDDGTLGKNLIGNHWNRSGLSVCVHAFIGKGADGKIYTYQTLPWDHRGWHCGDKANNTHISFEICEDGLKDEAYFNAVYKEAVELTAHLCRMYSLDPKKDGVVICHQEGYRRGVASNHSDVLHWFPKHGKTMDDFRTAVAGEIFRLELEEAKQKAAEAAKQAAEDAKQKAEEKKKEQEDEPVIKYKTLDEIPDWGRPAIEKLINKGYLKGTGEGLDISEDMLRIIVINDRAGIYDILGK